MAEIAIGLFAAMGTAGAAGTAAATAGGITAAAGQGMAAVTALANAGAATAATAGATAAAGSTALSIFQGMTTAASVLSSGASAVAALTGGMAEERAGRVTAEGERIASEGRAMEIRRDLLQRKAANRVTFAASGVDAGYGTPDAVARSLDERAAYEIDIVRRNANLRGLRARMRGEQAHVKGQFDALRYGAAGAGRLGNYAIDLLQRG